VCNGLGIFEIKAVDTLVTERNVQVLACPVVLGKNIESKRAHKAQAELGYTLHIHINSLLRINQITDSSKITKKNGK
jgi:hypothetical protein